MTKHVGGGASVWGFSSHNMENPFYLGLNYVLAVSWEMALQVFHLFLG